MAPEATRQEAAGAAITRRDKATYAQQHEAFSQIEIAVGISATPVGAAAHSVDGDSARPKPPATEVATCYIAVHNVDSSFSHHRAAEYAKAKRRTLNQNQESEEEGLNPVERIGYEHTHSEPQGINLSEPENCRRMGSTPKEPLMQVHPTIVFSDLRRVVGEPDGEYFCDTNPPLDTQQRN